MRGRRLNEEKDTAVSAEYVVDDGLYSRAVDIFVVGLVTEHFI